MVHILPKVQGFGEKLGTAIGGGLGQGFQQGMSKGQEFANKMELQLAKQKKDSSVEKQKSLASLQGTVSEMQGMLENDDSGFGVAGQYSPFGNSFANRGRFKVLSSDLLSYYKSLFPRGLTQQEFLKFEKDYLPKIGEPVSTMKSKLGAFQDLIENKLDEDVSEKSSKSSGSLKNVKSGTPLTAEALQKIIDKVGNDKEKVRATAKKMGYKFE